MLQLQYPQDTITAWGWHDTFCTATTLDPYTGKNVCVNQIQTLQTPNATTTAKTILSVQFGGERGIDAELFCNGKFILQAYSNEIVKPVFIECDNTITWAYHASVQTDATLVLNYVPYHLTETNMATDTPYTAYTTFDNGVEYSYNPFISQIGILLWVLTFSIFTLVIIKLLIKK